jgi:hypothetical protein
MCTMKRKTIFSVFHKIQRLTNVAGVFLLLLLLLSLLADSQFVSQDNTGSNNRHIINTPAYGQLANTTTTISSSNNSSNNLQNASSFIIRGVIGSTIASTAANSDQGNQTSQVEGAQGYLVGGRWRMVVNQSIVERFVANLTIVGIDGRGPSYNIIIEDVGGSIDLRRSDNALISEITANIYPSNNRSANIIAPIQVEVRGNNIIQIVPLGIVDRMLRENEQGAQEPQLQILRSIDRQPIYGMIQAREITG